MEPKMEDVYIKPGAGLERPPQFSYGHQMARGPQKNPLNKRVAPPCALGTGAGPTAPPSSNPLAPPPCGAATPPLHPARPPPGGVATPPPRQGPMRSQREAASSQSESEPDVEGVTSVLNRALAACRHTVKDQVCNDVAKRLRLLEDSWRSGRLSLPVKRRMDALSLELQSGHWDSADEIHRSLMVDHVTEVSQWMVGVKRLIAETRNLSPELLETLKNPTGSVEDSAEPVKDSAEPVEDSAQPVEDSVEPVEDSAEPVKDSAEPVEESVEPVKDSAEPVKDSAEPVEDSAEPVEDSVEPVEDSVEPVQDP